MVAVWESCGGVLLVDLFRNWHKYVNRDIPSQQISTETYRSWNGHSEQNNVREMKRISIHWSVHNAKLHFKMSEKKETNINVCDAGTQTFRLWENALGSKPNQFCEFYPSIPRSHTAKHFHLTCSVHAKKQRTVEFITEQRVRCGKRVLRRRLSFMMVVAFPFFILAK